MQMFLNPMGVIASADMYHTTLYIWLAALLAISVNTRRLRQEWAAAATAIHQSGVRAQAQSGGQGAQEWKP